MAPSSVAGRKPEREPKLGWRVSTLPIARALSGVGRGRGAPPCEGEIVVQLAARADLRLVVAEAGKPDEDSCSGELLRYFPRITRKGTDEAGEEYGWNVVVG